MKGYQVHLKAVEEPEKDCSGSPVALTDKTIDERKKKVLSAMERSGIEQMVIYGDMEHGGNFEYLVGYYTRFEEALLIIKIDGTMNLALGNENLNKASKARVHAGSVHIPMFSLPNQPCVGAGSLKERLAEAGLEAGKKTGVVGWKLFTSPAENNDKLYDVPAFIVDAIKSIVGAEWMTNETRLFIGENGVRTTNNANELAHYEFAAALASDCMLDAMNFLDEGISEMELGDKLNRYGQHNSVVTIAASGPRFIKANMYPIENQVKIGDTISLTVGYHGGLSSRASYAVHDASELPEGTEDYVEKLAKPYFNCYASWLSELHIGMEGGELYQLVETVFPQETYHWDLCPGHLTAEEEWMSSPVYKGSKEILRSGMLLQVDIIPSIPGYGGVCAESTVALADAKLRDMICREYPEFWDRIQNRRTYLQEVLGIPISEALLPMCSTVAYLRPYMLDKSTAFVWETNK